MWNPLNWVRYLFNSPMRQLSPQEMEKIGSIVNKYINTNAVMVFSKSYCPYCVQAKDALTKKGKTYKAIELDHEGDGEAIQSYLLEKTGQRTVPNIFIKGNHVGGCSDLLALIEQGKFESMFK